MIQCLYLLTTMYGTYHIKLWLEGYLISRGWWRSILDLLVEWTAKSGSDEWKRIWRLCWWCIKDIYCTLFCMARTFPGTIRQKHLSLREATFKLWYVGILHETEDTRMDRYCTICVKGNYVYTLSVSLCDCSRASVILNRFLVIINAECDFIISKGISLSTYVLVLALSSFN